MLIKDLTTEQLQSLIRHTMNEFLDEYFGELDQDNDIKESFKESLFKIQQKRLKGRPTIPAKDVYKRYGIES